MERIFARLHDRCALGADDLQWVLYRARRKEPPPDLSTKNWTPVWFVRSTKDVLVRGMVDCCGLDEDTARSAVARLPACFDDWKASQDAS